MVRRAGEGNYIPKQHHGHKEREEKKSSEQKQPKINYLKKMAVEKKSKKGLAEKQIHTKPSKHTKVKEVHKKHSKKIDVKAKSKAQTPEIYVGFDESNEPKISIGRAAPSIKNLVLAGGGAKGIVYPTFLREMNKRVDFMNQLDEVAGSSAGASMAFLIAAGMTLDEIEEFLKSNSILEALKGGEKKKATQHVVLGTGYLPAIKLRELLLEVTSKSAALYYKENSEEIAKKISNKPGAYDFIKRAENNFSLGLTFNDLKILHEINPEKFKLLNVTAYDKDSHESIYFNAEKTPDINCFEAVVASMSIPFVVKSVTMDLKDGRGERRLMDGGVRSNVPLEIFAKRKGYDPTETLVLHFANSGHAFVQLHSPRNPVVGFFTRILNTLARVIHRIFSCIFLGAEYRAPRKDAKKVYRHGFNAMVMPHGEVGTTDFKLRDDSSTWQNAMKEAKLAAKVYRELSGRGHLVQREYKNIRQAIDSLTPKEFAALNAIAEEKIAKAENKIESGKESLTTVERLNIEILFYIILQAEYEKRIRRI